MFRKHSGRRSTNILFVTFRLVLSLVMFAVLLGGVYSAYKHFSGLDPLKLDPQQLLSQVLSSKNPKDILATISSIKLSQSITKNISQKVLGQSNSGDQTALENLTQPQSRGKVLFNFVLVADSHNNIVNLYKALQQSKQKNPSFVIGLGDYSDVGTTLELENAKKEFDAAGLRYFLAIGDHDLWDCRNKSLPPNCNFKSVFGPSYQSFDFNGFKFIILYNSDNYIGMDQTQLDWLSAELEKAKDQVKGIYVFVHEPLFHPSSDHVMGRVEPKLKQQAKSLVHILKDNGVKKVLAGDIHYFSEYSEPETTLDMVTVGAITSDRNPQSPRFAVGYVFEDGSLEVEDIEIK